MKYFIYLCFISGSIFAQTVDSIAIKQVDSLILVSRELTIKKNFDKALEVNTRAETIALEKMGHESEAYGSCCFNRGRVFYFKLDYQEAEKCFLEAKSIREKVLGKRHPYYATTISNLAIIYDDMRRFEIAEPLHLEAKTLREKNLGKEHLDYTSSLNNLASHYWKMGQYERAEPIYLEALTIRKKILGSEHPDYANSLNNLAVLYKDMGKFTKAELLFLEGKFIWERMQQKEHREYAAILSNLSGLYKAMGNFSKAESLCIEAKAIREKVLGKEHPIYAGNLGQLANLYADQGDFEKADLLYLEALTILEKTLGKENASYAGNLHNLAGLNYNMGHYEKAEELYLKAMAIREKVLGKENREYAASVQNLAYIYFILRDFAKAEQLFLQAISIQEKLLGKGHPNHVLSLINLANLYESQWRFSSSELLLKEAYKFEQTKLLNASTFLSELELAKYIAISHSSGANLNSIILARQTGKGEVGNLTTLAYDLALFYKGFLQVVAARLISTPITSPVFVEISLSLKGYRRRLAVEYAKPVSEQKGIAELEEKANLAEKELTRLVASYAESMRQVNWQDVQAQLKKTEVAVEFISFNVNFPRKSDSIIYAAILLKSGNMQPTFFPLFEEKSLDSLLLSKSERKADYVNSLYALADRGAIAIETPKRTLYEILWKPLENHLVGVKTIYFSPSGLLHRINLDAIPISETETLADKYQLIKLNSTRQLVIPNQTINANNEAVLYGGIRFEQDSILTKNETVLASRSRGELSFQYIDSTLRGGSWNYLPGTEREVNSIEKIMQTSGVHTNMKKGYEATEEAFKNIGANNSPTPRILHVATHGYFFSDPKVQTKSNGLSGQNESVFKISDHPMLRSGLIMAGGNAAWQGKQTPEGREDGVLTAYEISQMNLSNTELVVLSACETGLGEIQGNEGVYGLQRAFKIAGAKYLIMSLWQVPDKQTSLLMTTFYKKWLEDKMSIPDAFHAAQKQLRDGGLEPYYWAGFVLVE